MDERESATKLAFLISQPRAGSTLLQRVLANHPEVHSPNEPWIMLHPIYALREHGHEAEYSAQLGYRALRDFLATLENGRQCYIQALRAMGTTLYEAACAESLSTVFLDKTPRYYYVVPELVEIFPNATIIILLRNPLSILASILKTWVKGDWARLARHRDDLVEAPKKLEAAIRTLTNKVIVVHYEKLVEAPHEVVSHLCGILGIAYDPSMLEYGSQSPPPGRYGDPVGIHLHSRPSTDSLASWKALGQSQQTRHLAMAYLEELGPQLVNALGYDKEALCSELDQIPCHVRGPVVRWQRIFKPQPSRWNAIQLIGLEFIQNRRLTHATRELARVCLGRRR